MLYLNKPKEYFASFLISAATFLLPIFDLSTSFLASLDFVFFVSAFSAGTIGFEDVLAEKEIVSAESGFRFGY